MSHIQYNCIIHIVTSAKLISICVFFSHVRLVQPAVPVPLRGYSDVQNQSIREGEYNVNDSDDQFQRMFTGFVQTLHMFSANRKM